MINRYIHHIQELVNLIPSKYYNFEHQDVESRFTKNKKEKAPKQAIKEASKKAKRARLSGEAEGESMAVDVAGMEQESPADKKSELEFKPMSSTEELKLKLSERIKELKSQRGVGKKKRTSKLSKPIPSKSQTPRKDTTKATSAPSDAPQPAKEEQKSTGVLFSKFEFTKEKKKKNPLQPEKWKNLISLAQGEKLVDKQKQLARKDKKKEKSAKEWKERVKSVEHEQKKRQEKRNENLKNRKRPGFEGSRK